MANVIKKDENTNDINNINAVNDDILTLPLLPLRDIVVFPHMVIPLFVGREKSVAALDIALKDSKPR